MFAYELVQLKNGTYSIRSVHEKETFHPVVGPVEEARQLYVEQLHLPARIAAAREPFTIWDIGLGAAANVLTVIQAAAPHSAQLRILSFDHTLAPLQFAIEHAEALQYPKPFSAELTKLLDKRRIHFQHRNLQIDWQTYVGDFPTLLGSRSSEDWPKPEAILFDAFSPAKNPAMWTLPLFTRLHDLLDSSRPCAMPTYSRSTMLRVTLLLAGFYVGTGRSIADKDQTTIAANTLSLIEAPLEQSWLKRVQNSTCAEPIRMPEYQRQPLTAHSLNLLLSHPQFREKPKPI